MLVLSSSPVDVRRLRRISNSRLSCSSLSIDFEKQTLVNGLRANGYSPDKPAFVSWLSVTRHLTRETILDTRNQAAAVPGG